MQGAEDEIQAKSRSDEELINFRPSPNFKHKKYLRSKFEEAMMIEANTSLLENEKANNVLVESSAQPPLPPNPPPPDTPPLLLNVKQEIEDDTYTGSTAQTSPELEQADELKAATATIKTDYTEEKPVTMCRNFARGTCKKGASCIFAHELILSQLPGVYTFCRNFQNSVCSFPKCKFVHATVFEKEHFFRTGYLPPHTLAHLKEPVVQAPLPPPQSEVRPTGQPAVYSNGAPNPSLPCVQPAVGQYNTETSAEPIFNIAHSVTSTTSPKCEWSNLDEASSSTRVLESGVPLAKKCKNCDSNEIRAQLMKAKVEKAALANKELKQKIALLNKKNAMRASLFGIFLKPTITPSADDGLHFNADKELHSLLGNSNLTSILAKMLRNADSSTDAS